MPENLGEARLRLTADSKQLDRKLEQASAKMKKVGLGMVAVGAAVAAPLVGAVKIFAEYEQSMANVQAVSSATVEEFEALDNIAREMGRTTVFTARESAQALSFMSMAGMEAHESVAALPHVLNLAAAGQLELGSAADIVTNVMAGYGIATEDLGMAVDVLTKGFTSANTDLGQLGERSPMPAPWRRPQGYLSTRRLLPFRSWGTPAIKVRWRALRCVALLPGYSTPRRRRGTYFLIWASRFWTLQAKCSL